MSRFFLGFLVSIVVSNSAYSADERGNGGDAVVCRTEGGGIVTAEALDHYEARTQLGIDIDAGFPANSILEAVENVLDRIPDFDVTRKTNYQTWADHFNDDANYLQGVTLVDIPDSNHIAIPRGCEIEQLVVQRPTSLPRQKRYTINRDIWDHMNDASKVSMIVHEIVYREALDLGHLNSINTRYITARLLDRNFTDLTVAEYAKTLDETGLPVEEVCEQVNYVTGFRTFGNGRRPDVSERLRKELCYVAGSKVALSEGTSRFILSKSFEFPNKIVELVGVLGGNFNIRYDTRNLSAFQTVTATELPGYLGLFEVGTECRSYRVITSGPGSGGLAERPSCSLPIQ